VRTLRLRYTAEKPVYTVQGNNPSLFSEFLVTQMQFTSEIFSFSNVNYDGMHVIQCDLK